MYEYAVYGLNLHGADPEALRNFKHSIHAIATDFWCSHQDSFDTTWPCVICGERGHDLNSCQQLQDDEQVKHAYVQLHVAIQCLLKSVENITSMKELSKICTMGLAAIESYDIINSL